MVPGAGVEPARCYHRGILSPLRLPISPPGHCQSYGGWGRNRTGVHGVAVRCMTTLPPSHLCCQRKGYDFTKLLNQVKKTPKLDTKFRGFEAPFGAS